MVSSPSRSGGFRERYCDLLDVLGSGRQQTLPCEIVEAAQAGIAVAVELLGVGEGALHRLLSSFVDGLAPRCLSMAVGALSGALPDMTGDGPLRLGV